MQQSLTPPPLWTRTRARRPPGRHLGPRPFVGRITSRVWDAYNASKERSRHEKNPPFALHTPRSWSPGLLESRAIFILSLRTRDYLRDRSSPRRRRYH